MPKKLTDWAKEKGVKYATAYNWVKNSKMSEPTYKNEGGGIMVGEKPIANQAVANNSSLLNYRPLAVDYHENDIAKKAGSATTTRSNRAADIQPLDRFANIDQVFLPFRYSYVGQNADSNLNIREVLLLCQKAYFGYAIVRSLIETQTLFSSSKIYFEGGNKKSRDFFTAYFKSIKLEKFQEQFFREFWRSGNVFIWRLNGKVKDDDLKKLTQTYGLNISEASVRVPVQYTVLNPVDVEIKGTSSFLYPSYYKILQDYELERLRSPQNDQDREILKALPEDVRKMIKDTKTNVIWIPLNEDNICAVFNGKQDYESFAIPQVFSVLDSLEHKTQLLKIDRAIAKTAQQAVLLVTTGYEDKAGNYVYNQNAANDINALLTNESTFKAIVCDFTTKMEFVLPQIGEILDPKKYEMIQKDLEEGLGHIMFTAGGGGEKFSSLTIKVKIFIERIRSAREKFLNEFLIDEIKRISQQLGFKNYPTPKFEEIDIEDSNEFKRIVTQLANMGFLTPQETFEAIETKKFPDEEQSLEDQRKFKEFKEEGLYESPTNKPQDGSLSNGGRPQGTKSPQTTKNVSPMGTGSLFSLTKIKDNVLAANKFEEELDSYLKTKFKVKKFSKDQKEVRDDISFAILSNFEAAKWNQDTIDSFLTQKPQLNESIASKINQIIEEHNVDRRLAAILNASTK